jgi:hypothetical protein
MPSIMPLAGRRPPEAGFAMRGPGAAGSGARRTRGARHG